MLSLDSMGFPFFLTVLIDFIDLVVYIQKWYENYNLTDTLQTTFMLSTVVIISYTLMNKMNLDISGLFFFY